MRRRKRMDDNWHTGKPEEEGQYLVYCDDGIGADVDDFLNGEWHFYGDLNLLIFRN